MSTFATTVNPIDFTSFITAWDATSCVIDTQHEKCVFETQRQSDKKKLKWFVAVCSQCKTIFVRAYSKYAFFREYVFCTRECSTLSQKSGVIKQKKRQHFLQKYGVDNPFGAKEIIDRKKCTMQKLYGVDNVSQIADVKEKKRKTCLKNIGVDSPQKCKQVREKTKATCVEKYGSSTVLNTAESREKLRAVLQSDEYRNHCKELSLQRYGVENSMQREEVKEKSKKTCLERYGVDNVFKRPDVVKKRVEKLIENSKRVSSKREDECYDLLVKKFGVDDVCRHVCVMYKRNNFWIVDFFIKSKNTYLQYDGVFWHGLDESILNIRERAKNNDPFAKMKLKAIRKDRYQDLWFRKHDMKLLRIREDENMAQAVERV